MDSSRSQPSLARHRQLAGIGPVDLCCSDDNFELTVINVKRSYTMRARAASAERTRGQILAAAVALLKIRLRTDIRLEDVAADADVTVQTVLRVFGSKAELFKLAFDEVLHEMERDLGRAEVGDVPAAVRTWFDHYEEYGDVVIASLAEERDPAVAPIVRVGRTRHRERVETVLAPQLQRFAAAERKRVVDALVCVCDVYTWKLLRRDMRRSRANAERTVNLMIDSILGSD